MPDFLLPDLGEGLNDAEVIAWRVAVGDHVTVDQVVAEVETAKAVVEVPVPFAGIVTEAARGAGRDRRRRRRWSPSPPPPTSRRASASPVSSLRRESRPRYRA